MFGDIFKDGAFEEFFKDGYIVIQKAKAFDQITEFIEWSHKKEGDATEIVARVKMGFNFSLKRALEECGEIKSIDKIEG